MNDYNLLNLSIYLYLFIVIINYKFLLIYLKINFEIKNH